MFFFLFGDGDGEVCTFRFPAVSRANLSTTAPSTSSRVDMTTRLQHALKIKRNGRLTRELTLLLPTSSQDRSPSKSAHYTHPTVSQAARILSTRPMNNPVKQQHAQPESRERNWRNANFALLNEGFRILQFAPLWRLDDECGPTTATYRHTT